MAAPLYDPLSFDFDNPLFGIETIRSINAQRHEMEQLTGIVHVDRERHGIVGFKDVTDQEFWVSGHMPGFPLMPGVIICECVAQLASFYARKFDLLAGDVLGFGGINHVRFRSPVHPGSRLVLMALCTKVRSKKLATFDFQAWVGETLSAEGELLGIGIPADAP
ncbi:MAG: 3-hydroxyacyl-ACP dehydratase FabZ family protein [Planctomycetales bacterium]